MSQGFAERLNEMGITLPEAPLPVANYVPTVLHNGLLYVSGQLPLENGKLAITGKLGGTISIEDGQRAAKLCAINILAQANAALSGLDRITQIVRISGFVASTPDFTDQPKVVNGASDLFAQVFGDAGKHARAAVGVPVLPLDAAVEVEAIIAVKEA